MIEDAALLLAAGTPDVFYVIHTPPGGVIGEGLDGASAVSGPRELEPDILIARLGSLLIADRADAPQGVGVDLELPAELMARNPTRDEIVDYQVNSGEFATAHNDVRKLVEQRQMLADPPCYERRRPNGVILEIRTAPLPGGGGVRTYSDVTERCAREDALKRAEADYLSIFQNAIVGFSRTSFQGKLLRANPALVRMNGYDNEEEFLAAVNSIAAEWYVDPRRRDEFVRAVNANGLVTDFVSEVYRHKTREKMWVSVSAWLVRDSEGTPLYFEGAVVDVTERRIAEAKLTYLARHDTLTGLANRSYFMESLKAAADSANPAEQLLSALTINLGRFKEVNDTLGHAAGDELLRMAARRIRRAAGSKNLSARLGADLFATIVADQRNRNDVLQLCERIVDALSRPFRVRRQRITVGVSIGVAFFPEHGEDAEELLRNSDAALFAGRTSGPWPYSIYNDEMNAGLQHRRRLEADLRMALQRDELFLSFQPIVNAATSECVGAEALMRWRHPEFGMVPPSEFIPIAEEAGMMSALGEWALKRACIEAAQSFAGLKIAVNISPMQFRSEGLVTAVLNALHESSLPPDQLELEITESALLNDDPFTMQALTELRAIGVSLALDDFGTGHSSFSYLLKFQFDKIKIDRSFVSSLGRNRGNAAVVRAVANLASDLGVQVVAEGVETAEQLAEISRLGCSLAQGFLFSHARPAAAMLSALAARRLDNAASAA